MKIGIVFGALADPLHKQLGLPRPRLRYLQECADGVTALKIGGLLTDAEADRVRRRIVTRILRVFGKELAR